MHFHRSTHEARAFKPTPPILSIAQIPDIL
jgi:hypothetical protein